MGRYDRTWPTAITAIVAGLLAGHAILPSAAVWLVGAAPEAEPAPAKLLAPAPAERPAAEPAEAERTPLTLLGAYDTDALLQVLRSSPVTADRRHAALILGNQRNTGRVLAPLMIALRTDESAEVRFSAAASLARLRRPESRGPLYVSARRDDDLRVREAATAALGAIGGADALENLISVLEHDTSDDVRAQAARSIMRIMGHDAWPEVEALVSGHSERVRDAAWEELQMMTVG